MGSMFSSRGCNNNGPTTAALAAAQPATREDGRYWLNFETSSDTDHAIEKAQREHAASAAAAAATTSPQRSKDDCQ